MLLLIIGPLKASVSLPLTFETLAKEADRVVIAGLISGGTSAWGPKKLRIFTTYSFEVSENIAGKGPAKFTVVQPGGQVGRWKQLVRGYPRFQKDVRILMFLRKIGSRFRVVGMSQGVFSFRKEGGREFLHQDLKGMSFHSSYGQSVSHGRPIVLELPTAIKRIQVLWQAKEAP